jgi:hypothetical protein
MEQSENRLEDGNPILYSTHTTAILRERMHLTKASDANFNYAAILFPADRKPSALRMAIVLRT